MNWIRIYHIWQRILRAIENYLWNKAANQNNWGKKADGGHD